VIEDDKFMRIQLQRAMEQVGYRVAEACDGEEGLAAYMRLQPDIVLLDALMPVMDGFTCCTQLRSLPGGDRIPVLMITALEDRESVDRAFEGRGTGLHYQADSLGGSAPTGASSASFESCGRGITPAD
jgi:PleD family two-component response regulator